MQIQSSGLTFSDPTSGVPHTLELQFPDTEKVDWLSGNCSAA